MGDGLKEKSTSNGINNGSLVNISDERDESGLKKKRGGKLQGKKCLLIMVGIVVGMAALAVAIFFTVDSLGLTEDAAAEAIVGKTPSPNTSPSDSVDAENGDGDAPGQGDPPKGVRGMPNPQDARGRQKPPGLKDTVSSTTILPEDPQDPPSKFRTVPRSQPPRSLPGSPEGAQPEEPQADDEAQPSESSSDPENPPSNQRTVPRSQSPRSLPGSSAPVRQQPDDEAQPSGSLPGSSAPARPQPEEPQADEADASEAQPDGSEPDDTQPVGSRLRGSLRMMPQPQEPQGDEVQPDGSQPGEVQPDAAASTSSTIGPQPSDE